MLIAKDNKIPLAHKLISLDRKAFEDQTTDPKKLQAKLEDVIIGDYVQALQEQGINEVILMRGGKFLKCRI